MTDRVDNSSSVAVMVAVVAVIAIAAIAFFLLGNRNLGGTVNLPDVNVGTSNGGTPATGQ